MDVCVPENFREAVSNVFMELGSGIEEPASSALNEAVIRGYFLEEERVQETVAKLKRRIGNITGYKVEIAIKSVKAEDWAVSWRRHYEPLRIGRSLVVKPTWTTYQAKPEDLVLQMDPGMAFGCGTHATTRLCLQLLEEYMVPGCTLVDVGTGSGILAMAGSLLGAGKVWAVDEDPIAIRTAAENLALNNLEAKVCLVRGNLLDDITPTVDLVVANIIAEVLMELSPTAAFVLKSGGHFIASGITISKENMVRKKLVADGFRLIDRWNEEEWVALVGVKK